MGARLGQMRSKRDYVHREPLDGRGEAVNVAEGLELHQQVVNACEQALLQAAIEGWVDAGRQVRYARAHSWAMRVPQPLATPRRPVSMDGRPSKQALGRHGVCNVQPQNKPCARSTSAWVGVQSFLGKQ